MCGIFGHWNRDGAPVDLVRVERAATSIHHRGPDDEGYLLVNTRSGAHVMCGGRDTAPELGLPPIESVRDQHFDLALAFRRLAILDLSPAGHQPMPGNGRRHWIVFNGEIYNFIELRAELEALGHVFHSGTDTEVILAAYAQWGRAAVERLRGMFAFAIWDASEERLWLARDRFGIKPLFVARNGASLMFGSEAKALITAGVEFRPSPTASAAYLALGRLPSASGGSTFFEGIEAAPAAHTLTVTRTATDAAPYWRLPEAERGALPEATARERYGELFTQSLRMHLRADVPVGTCLSGGLDSSSIVALAGKLMREEHPAALERLGAHQQTFSAVYDDDGVWDERRHIDRVIAATGAAANFVVPTREQLLRDLDALVWHQDEPFTTTSMFAQWSVMRLARERGVTVLLDGQGADEILGGYHSVYGPHLRTLLRRGKFATAAREAVAVRHLTGLPGPRFLVRELAGIVPGVARALRRRRRAAFELRAGRFLLRGAARLLRDEWASGGFGDMRSDHRGVDEYLRFAVTSDPLPNLLRYEDRNSMAFSIEGRVPFLDHELVEFVFRYAPDFRVRHGWTKWLQRVTIDPLLPPEITWRRDKVGFDTPHGELTRGIGCLIRDEAAASPAIHDVLDLHALKRMGDAHDAWRSLCYLTWMRLFREAAR